MSSNNLSTTPAFTEININDIQQEDRKNVIQSRWVHREKGTEVRSRMVAKGYNELVNDLDDIDASTPLHNAHTVYTCTSHEVDNQSWRRVQMQHLAN